MVRWFLIRTVPFYIAIHTGFLLPRQKEYGYLQYWRYFSWVFAVSFLSYIDVGIARFREKCETQRFSPECDACLWNAHASVFRKARNKSVASETLTGNSGTPITSLCMYHESGYRYTVSGWSVLCPVPWSVPLPVDVFVLSTGFFVVDKLLTLAYTRRQSEWM